MRGYRNTALLNAIAHTFQLPLDDSLHETLGQSNVLALRALRSLPTNPGIATAYVVTLHQCFPKPLDLFESFFALPLS